MTNRACLAAVSLSISASLLHPLVAETVDTSAAATLSGTIQPGGPRTGANGTNYFNVEGVSGFESFGVLDFTASSFALPAISSISDLTLTLTESNTSFTTALGGLAFYLASDTTTSIAEGSGTTLAYQTANGPEGVGTQLGTLYSLGTGTFSSNVGNTGSGTVDTYHLTLDSDSLNYITTQLNTTGAILRLIVVPTDTTGASTWAGSTFTTNTSWRPTLSFTATLDQSKLEWVGGSGTWTATGGTDWSGGTWDPTKTATFATGSGTVALGTPVTTVGTIFQTDGYTIAGSAGNTLTLSSATGGNSISVTNASDTATISAEIAGAAGLTKNGAGTLVLSGANSFTGAVTINAGVLAVGDDSNFGAAANGIALSSGTLKSTAAFTVGSTRALSGSGTIDSSAGALTFAGAVNVSSIVVADNSSVTFSGTTAAIGSAAVGTGSTLVISAPVTSSGRTTFTGNGTVELDADNSTNTAGFAMNYVSGTTGPKVILGSPTALGIGTLYLNAGELNAAADFTGDNAIYASISLGGSATLSGGNMEFKGAFGFYGSYARTLTITGTTTVTINSAITPDSYGNNQDILIKDGTGKLILNASNTSFGYDDGTQVLAGTLETGPEGALGLGPVTVSAGALLRLDNELSIDDLSDLFLLAGGSSFGMLDLNFDGSAFETVNSLTVDGVTLPAGIYNAENLPDYITGTGNLIVAVPEPRMTLLLVISAVSLFAFPTIRRCQRI